MTGDMNAKGMLAAFMQPDTVPEDEYAPNLNVVINVSFTPPGFMIGITMSSRSQFVSVRKLSSC